MVAIYILGGAIIGQGPHFGEYPFKAFGSQGSLSIFRLFIREVIYGVVDVFGHGMTKCYRSTKQPLSIN